MRPERTTYTEVKTEAIGFRKVGAYVKLLKLRLTLLVVFSAVFGYMMAAETFSGWSIFLIGLSALLVTGASNTLNQVLETDLDRLMTRTQKRPMPAGQISATAAVVYALTLGALGIAILVLQFGLVAGLLGIIALISYAFVYTPLKRITPLGVMVGAIPGSMPPLIGWAAATGNLSEGAWVLFLLQFLWQFPHFWAIAWVLHDDYQKAGFKMLPSNSGRTSWSASMILIYTALLIPVCILPLVVGMSGWITTVIIGVMGVWMTWKAFQLLRQLDIAGAKKLMFGSFIYLPVVQIAMMVDRFIG